MAIVQTNVEKNKFMTSSQMSITSNAQMKIIDIILNRILKAK